MVVSSTAKRAGVFDKCNIYKQKANKLCFTFQKQQPINILHHEPTIEEHTCITCLKLNSCAQPQKTGSTLIDNGRVSVTLVRLS